MVVVARNFPRSRKCPKCGVANGPGTRHCMVCGAMISKHLNQKVRMDGFTFDSMREADRYLVLLMRQKIGEISGLKVHPRFLLRVNGEKICTYIADFQYWECRSDIMASSMVVEDPKGKRTRDYILKKKLMRAVYGIEIEEV
jgi:hypothetical protein